MRLFCNYCKQHTNHEELKSHSQTYWPKDDPDMPVDYAEGTWQIVQCAGCDRVSFRELWHTSEDGVSPEGPVPTEFRYPEADIEKLGDDDSLTRVSIPDKKTKPEHRRNVFIIHGRDDGRKETVARFISQLGLNPIILHEQPNQGQTIIEKFERHAEVAFAIALLTPDDTGGLAGEEQSHKPRARQNVIFEFGYFMGKLGRHRVCALKEENVEIPSDYDGVLYISLDAFGAWKMELAKELKNVGFEVDMNRVLE